MSNKGKDAMYAGIGIGAAAALGLAGYGIYDALQAGVTGSTVALKNCEEKYAAEVTLYNNYLQKFISEDVKNNVPFSSAQQSYLNGITAEQEKIAKTCYADNWLADSASVLSYAFAIGIVTVFGAVAYRYIKKKGYLKPPKGKNGVEFFTPSQAMASMQMGIFDYEKTIGVIPVYWNSQGTNALNDTANNGDTLTQEFVASMEEANIITEAAGIAIIAASTAIIAEELSLALLAFA